MTRYRSQAELTAAIIGSRRRLERTLDGIAPAELPRPGVVGDWSVKDLLAHLAAWQRLLLYWYAQGKTGAVLAPNPTGMSRRAIDMLNAEIYQTHHNDSLAAVQIEYHSAYAAALELVQSLSEDELYTPGHYAWTGKYLLADYAAANTCQHDDWANRMLHNWLRSRA
ncbi:MAG: ClbS/DfsB family four-helix bundle protein [Chloroflexi bacterium]|nr:ClbS/DfsB family four-helix bundle protein [Chloroflexota bacterium]